MRAVKFNWEFTMRRSASDAPAVAVQLSDRRDSGLDTAAARGTAGAAGEVRGATESGRAGSASAVRGKNGSAGDGGAQRIAEFAGAAIENFRAAGEEF